MTGDFVVIAKPIYPPSSFGIQIYFKNNNEEFIPILSKSLTTYITTEFDWKQTTIHGDGASGGPVDKDFTFNVLLKDTKGYCYE